MTILQKGSLTFLLSLGLAHSAFSFEVIPVQCVVELVKNDVTLERHVGACGYDKPLIVSPSADKSPLPSGDPSFFLQKNHLSPGFHATIFVGHDLVKENPSTNLIMRYALVRAADPQKVRVIEGGAPKDINLPVNDTNFGGGSAMFKKGDKAVLTSFIEGSDRYEVRVGLI